tara:strand:+ start:194 stop:550 length:357 start_codon:yes stop_codon:yes gene_type:complete
MTTPKHFLEAMKTKHPDYFLGLDLSNTFTIQLLNFAKERMYRGSAVEKESFILNIESLSAYLSQESMCMDLNDALDEICFYMGANGQKLKSLEYTWRVGLTDRDHLLDEYLLGKKSQA